MLENRLKNIGFSDNSIRIYKKLLESSGLKAGELIKQTGLQRSVVYGVLKGLVERGLVTSVEIRGVAVFTANSPEALLDEMDDKRKMAESAVRDIRSLLAKNSREVTLLEGDDIVERIALKGLESARGSTVYFMGSTKSGIQAALEPFWIDYHQKRQLKSIWCKILYDTSTDQSIMDKRNNIPLCRAKYMPFGYDIPMWFHIWNDENVAIIVPGGDVPLAFHIKSKDTADALISYFKFLWDAKD